MQEYYRAWKKYNCSSPIRQAALKFCLQAWGSYIACLCLLSSMITITQQTTFLSPCLVGKRSWKVFCQAGKSTRTCTCPRRPDGPFFSTGVNYKINNFQEVVNFFWLTESCLLHTLGSSTTRGWAWPSLAAKAAMVAWKET